MQHNLAKESYKFSQYFWFLYNLYLSSFCYVTLQIRVLNYAKYEMRNKALESFGDLRDDEELGPADWPTIIRHITSLNNSDEGQIHPHNVGEGESYLQTMNLRDIRVRFLNGKLLVKYAYN